MRIGIILVTHPGVGSCILQTAHNIMGGTPLPVHCIEVPMESSADTIVHKKQVCITQAAEYDQVLILTDIYAATPHNVANHAANQHTVVILAGLNVPMLLRIFNYADEPDIAALYANAKQGAVRGIC